MGANPRSPIRKSFPVRSLALSLGAVLVAAACASDTTGPENPSASEDRASIQILLTDAPSDMLATANVWISRIYLVGGGGAQPDTVESEAGNDDPSGKVDLFNDPENPLLFDLLTLRDGNTADLTGYVDVDVTSYRGLRFVVDSAAVTLAEGFQYEDGADTGALKIPSGQSSGIKVKIDDIIEPSADDVLVVTVDFDVDENFNIQTHPQTGDVRRILFKPVLREMSRVKR